MGFFGGLFAHGDIFITSVQNIFPRVLKASRKQAHCPQKRSLGAIHFSESIMVGQQERYFQEKKQKQLAGEK